MTDIILKVQVPTADFAYVDFNMSLSQFGFLYAGPGSTVQLWHIDDLYPALLSIFLISDIEVADGSVSASSAPGTQFLDLEDYNFSCKTIFDINTKSDLLELNNVQIWGPKAKFFTKQLTENNFVQFYSTTIHRGSGSGRGSSEHRFVVFAAFTTANNVFVYQKTQFQILAPEMLLQFHERGPHMAKKEGQKLQKEAAQLLKDWESEVGRDGVIFNYYQKIRKGQYQLSAVGKSILGILKSVPSQSDQVDDGSNNKRGQTEETSGADLARTNQDNVPEIMHPAKKQKRK